MALSADNVKVGVTGGAFKAPLGTTLPTTSGASLNVAFKEVGYLSEEGIVQSIGTDTTDIKAWQDGTTVRKVKTSFDLTYQLTMIESNEHTLEAYFGNYSAGAVEISADLGARKSWVFNVVDGSDQIRVVIPDGDITERGDVEFKNDGAISYPITITAYPDDNGVNAYLYLTDADILASA